MELEDILLPEGTTIEDVRDHILMERHVGRPLDMSFGTLLSEDELENLSQAFRLLREEMGLPIMAPDHQAE